MLYFLAITATLLIFILRVLLVMWFGDAPYTSLFLAPVIFCAYLGGLKLGLFATALAFISLNHQFLHLGAVLSGLALGRPVQTVQWLLLLSLGITISAVLHHLQSGRCQSEAHDYLQRQMLDLLEEAIVRIDLEGQIAYLNNSAEQLLGWRSAEAIGQPGRLVLQLLEAQTKEPLLKLEEVLAASSRVEIPHGAVLVTRQGIEVPVEAQAAPLAGANGGGGESWSEFVGAWLP